MIYTIGHSTRTADEFRRILHAYAIEELIDIRTIPRSARNPQFNRDTLALDLTNGGIGYEHMKELGGLRKARRDSVNTAWKNASFQGYADYMQTAEFTAALDALIARSSDRRVCVMCAEAVPWRCHRNLVADALAARGIGAIHIMSAEKSQPHAMTKFARVVERDTGEAGVIYPREGLDFE